MHLKHYRNVSRESTKIKGNTYIAPAARIMITEILTLVFIWRFHTKNIGRILYVQSVKQLTAE